LCKLTAIDIVAVAGTLSKVEDGLALIRVLNYKLYSIILKKGLKLANILYPAAVLINSSLIPQMFLGYEQADFVLSINSSATKRRPLQTIAKTRTNDIDSIDLTAE